MGCHKSSCRCNGLQFTFKKKPLLNYPPGDFVLISKLPVNQTQVVHVIAAVDTYSFPNLTVKTVLKLGEGDIRALAIKDELYENSEWYMRKLFNVNQCLKEYESLQFIEELQLLDQLLNTEDDEVKSAVYKLPKDRKSVV